MVAVDLARGVTVMLVTVTANIHRVSRSIRLKAGTKGLGVTVNADRLLFPPRAARTTFTVYVFWLVPFCAVTDRIDSGVQPAGFRGVMVRACPEFVACPFTVMLAVVACSVGVTVTLVTLLHHIHRVAQVVSRVKVGANGPGDTLKPDRLLFPPGAARIKFTV